MTLIVGILCQDGIVVGADGAASLGVLGQMTARQPVKKLSIITDPLPMIVGVSGSVGMSQRITDIFSRLYPEKKLVGKGGNPPLRPVEAMVMIRHELWTGCIHPEIVIAMAARQLVGNIADRDCLCSCLAALPIGKELCLFQFDQQAHPEMASKDLPFVAIGSGEIMADPFLAYLRDIFWQKRQPSVAEGIFATWWTLHHAIKTSPGGVADPIQIAVLAVKKDGSPICDELSEEELIEAEVAVTNAEKHLADFKLPTKQTDIPAAPLGG